MGELFNKKVIFVVGPTAVGKSSFAVQKATETEACIVNADSLQAYTDLNIGTAKPTLEEMSQVPHYLFNTVALGELITAGEYRRQALLHLKESSEALQFFVGGSGFYIQALEKGMFDVGPISNEVKERVLGLIEKGRLYQSLQEVDPQAASAIAENDSYRLQRALEISLMGRPFSQVQAEFKNKKFPYPLLKIGFKRSREKLRQRIEQRTELMWEAGLFNEVSELLKTSPELKNWAPLSSVGYKETLQALECFWSKEEWQAELVKNTMRLAKRQMTWFKRDSDILWVDLDEGDGLSKASEAVDSFRAKVP